MPAKEWGRIFVVTRLEKQVDSQFVFDWSHLIGKGLRTGLKEKQAALKQLIAVVAQANTGKYTEMETAKALNEAQAALDFQPDAFGLVKDRVAHQAANGAARMFLNSDYETIAYIDSDASMGYDLIEDMRNLEEGKEYDALQAFYPRRGWPPEAIWFQKTVLGDVQQCVVWEDDYTTEVALIGLHATLIRREVFEAMLDEKPEIGLKHFDFFFYPRHEKQSEDSAFSLEATRLGFRLGATTVIKTGHISRVVTGWETYQEFLTLSNIRGHWEDYHKLVGMVAEFLDEDPEMVMAKANRATDNVVEGIEKYKPETAEEFREFYGKKDSGYFYELLAWNFSPFYGKTIKPLKEIEDKRVLVVGAGLGGEIEAMRYKNDVTFFELPGALRDFLVNVRFRDDPEQERHVRFYDKESLLETNLVKLYDLITAIDTIEHFHPDEFIKTMDAMLALLDKDGSLYFRNNFGHYDPKFPTHFDHTEAYAKWIEDNNLEIYETLEETQAHFIRRKS